MLNKVCRSVSGYGDTLVLKTQTIFFHWGGKERGGGGGIYAVLLQ